MRHIFGAHRKGRDAGSRDPGEDASATTGLMVIKLLYIEDNDDNLYTLTLRFETLGGYEVVARWTKPKGSPRRSASGPMSFSWIWTFRSLTVGRRRDDLGPIQQRATFPSSPSPRTPW